MAVLEDLNEQGYPPAIVFQSLSVDPSVALVRDSSDDSVLNAAQDFLARWESEWPEMVTTFKSFLKRHDKIVRHSIDGKKVNLRKECKNALTALIQCAQIIFKSPESAVEWLDSTWLDFPIKPTIISVLQQETVSEREAVDLYQRYHHSAAIVLEKLAQLLEINRMTNILSSGNLREEMRVLFNAGNYLRNGDFDNAIEEINSNIEKKIRVAFHLAFSLHYGGNYMRALPTSAQERISNLNKKGPPSLRRTVDQNLFYHFSRSEYADVVNTKNNWRNMFEEVFSPKTRGEVVNALRITFALDDRKQHRDRKDYFRNMREAIRQSILNADWLFASLAKVLHLSINPHGFVDEMQDEYRKVRISFAGQDKCDSSYPWRIERSKEIEIASRLTKMSRTVNFSDDIAVSTLFNGTFAEVFITIAVLLKSKRIEVHDLPEGNMYLQIVPRKSQASHEAFNHAAARARGNSTL